MNSAVDLMNYYGRRGIPFLFVIDFDMNMPIVVPLYEIKRSEILYNVNGHSNCSDEQRILADRLRASRRNFTFLKKPLSYRKYKPAFDLVRKHFILGNTFLLNLTFPTPIETDLTFDEIFHLSSAKYRLLIRGKLVVFSPECFIRIRGNLISSYPMKGTIDASIPDAHRVLLADTKETAEHVTIVDLIRNDIGMVAHAVRVRRFRYIDTIRTSENTLLQVSSEITGLLQDGFAEGIGSIILRLLPAGSITGAPKTKTVEIIREAEGYERGYYTGIFGIFDGANLDSAVMIRYIEKKDNGLYFKSGGGLTIYSDPRKEYQELIDKIYVPIVRNH